MSFDSLLKAVTVFCFWRVNQKHSPVKSPAKVEQGFLFCPQFVIISKNKARF